MWPMPRAPISSTRNLVSSVADRAVSGSPISLLSEPGVNTVGALRRRTWAMRSLVLVFAGRAGEGDEGRAERADDVPGEGAERRLDVVHDDRGHTDGARGQYGRRSRLDDRPRVVVAVHPFADEGDEEAAGLHLTGVPDDRPGDLDGRIRYVVRLPADDCCDLGEGEGDHKFIPGSSG